MIKHNIDVSNSFSSRLQDKYDVVMLKSLERKPSYRVLINYMNKKLQKIIIKKIIIIFLNTESHVMLDRTCSTDMKYILINTKHLFSAFLYHIEKRYCDLTEFICSILIDTENNMFFENAEFN